MKIRTLALAGAAALALSVPAAANGTDGWYVGLGVGWAMMSDLNAHVVGNYTPPAADYKLQADDSALIGLGIDRIVEGPDS